jgi:Transposase, Mutator family
VPLRRRQVFDAAQSSLKTISLAVVGDNEPFVRTVLCRTVAIAPELAVGDGALGFWKAIEEVFQGTRHQRCWVHKTATCCH